MQHTTSGGAGASRATERHTRPARWRTRLAVLAVFAFVVSGCNGLLQNDTVPSGVTDPAVTLTPQGALSAYRGAVEAFQVTFGGGGNYVGATSVIAMTGLMTDELQAGATLGSLFGGDAYILGDRHDFPESNGNLPTAQTYARINRARGQASQAIGLLSRYVPEQTVLAGRLYALQGYEEIFLAELFCSGTPLSTVDFNGDFTLRPGSNTAQVFTHALSLFDSAAALVGDSARFVDLVRVGRGRALLGLGQYADAAAAAAAVADDYRYTVSFVSPTGFNDSLANFAVIPSDNRWPFSVADHEALVGLNYRSSGDPRTPIELIKSDNGSGYSIYRFTNYATDGSSPLVVASGVEARLIEAEAAFQANSADGQWLVKLNALRTDGAYDLSGATPPDTLWHAGGGGVAGLAPLADPGTDDARVDLLFRERAFWLFLTGHRQGDLRRLIRQYGRDFFDIYPTGNYPGGQFYGTDATAPIPPQERDLNPNFSGCISRNA